MPPKFVRNPAGSDYSHARRDEKVRLANLFCHMIIIILIVIPLYLNRIDIGQFYECQTFDDLCDLGQKHLQFILQLFYAM